MSKTLSGRIELHKAENAPFPRLSRDVIVYLPPSYDGLPGWRFPVLYMHDGQNLFDAATAFAGNHWRLDEVAEELVQASQIEPLIIVGIYHAGQKRIAEYTHVKDGAGQGGRARFYGKLLIEDLKPYIDREYRTRPDAANTGLGGSSLGGLVTLYLGLRFPEIFGKLIVMSPSIWWANQAILKQVKRFSKKLKQRIWLDTGTCEGRNPVESVKDASTLRQALVSKGWRLGHDLAYMEDEGAEHNETAWGARMRDALKFLFPPTGRVRRPE